MLNSIILVARAVRDSELRFTSAGLGICRFTLACDRPPRKDKEKETDFINIVTFGKLAEICAEGVKKGKLYAVKGSLQIGQYEDKDGQKRTSADVIADTVRFLSPRNGQAPDLDSVSSEVDVPGDDLPF